MLQPRKLNRLTISVNPEMKQPRIDHHAEVARHMRSFPRTVVFYSDRSVDQLFGGTR